MPYCRKSVNGALLGKCVKYNKNLLFTFSLNASTGQTARMIFMADGLKDAESYKEVPLWVSMILDFI